MLYKALGITPSAVSPIGLVNDIDDKVIFMIDEEVWNADEICCHPNINTETLQIPGGEFRKLIKATGTTLEVRNLPLMKPNRNNL